MCLAIPAKVVELSSGEQDDRALVEVVGVRRHVGDWVLVHVGFAISRISGDRTLDQVRTLFQLAEEKASS